MVKFYLDEKEEKLTSKHLSLRCNYFISFDGGVTKSSLHQDALALRKAYEFELIDFAYPPYSRGHMFSEIIQSNDEVSGEVLDAIAEIAKKEKVKLPIDGALSLVNHPSVLKWLLKKGARCKHIKGRGLSTMENFLMKKKLNDEYADEMISLLKQYKAIDKKYLAKYKDEWSEYVLAAFK